jgi:hypothetical protein
MNGINWVRLGFVDSLVCGGDDDYDDENAWNFKVFVSKEFFNS